jgi:hypothetical protein
LVSSESYEFCGNIKPSAPIINLQETLNQAENTDLRQASIYFDENDSSWLEKVTNHRQP